MVGNGGQLTARAPAAARARRVGRLARAECSAISAASARPTAGLLHARRAAAARRRRPGSRRARPSRRRAPCSSAMREHAAARRAFAARTRATTRSSASSCFSLARSTGTCSSEQDGAIHRRSPSCFCERLELVEDRARGRCARCCGRRRRRATARGCCGSCREQVVELTARVTASTCMPATGSSPRGRGCRRGGRSRWRAAASRPASLSAS